jgi:hypothetical protein
VPPLVLLKQPRRCRQPRADAVRRGPPRGRTLPRVLARGSQQRGRGSGAGGGGGAREGLNQARCLVWGVTPVADNLLAEGREARLSLAARVHGACESGRADRGHELSLEVLFCSPLLLAGHAIDKHKWQGIIAQDSSFRRAFITAQRQLAYPATHLCHHLGFLSSQRLGALRIGTFPFIAQPCRDLAPRRRLCHAQR